MSRFICAIALVTIALPSALAAQDRPFVFSFATSRDAARLVRIDYELGVGDQALHQQTTNGPEQRIGIQASVGRLTFFGHVGVAAETTYDTSQQAELLVSLLAPNGRANTLAVGGGVLHEAGGTSVLLSRIVAGHEGTTTRVYGNLLLQKPLAAGRDAADMITTVGWAARLTPAVALGVEGIAEDVEGFWDPLEAEGGARILVGPSLHIAPLRKRWQLSFAGGQTFHPSTSPRTSDAIRDLPATTSRGGYAVRTTFACRF